MLVVAFFMATLIVVRADFAVVPVVAHEIDRHAARLIFAAVRGPISAVLVRHPHVDRLRRRTDNTRPLADHRLRHDDLRLRKLADIDAPRNDGRAKTNAYSLLSSEHWCG